MHWFVEFVMNPVLHLPSSHFVGPLRLHVRQFGSQAAQLKSLAIVGDPVAYPVIQKLGSHAPGWFTQALQFSPHFVQVLVALSNEYPDTQEIQVAPVLSQVLQLAVAHCLHVKSVEFCTYPALQLPLLQDPPPLMVQDLQFGAQLMHFVVPSLAGP
jgi:hypothetical protein